MKYVLGLDIGPASIGWAVSKFEEHAFDFGVHTFEAAQHRGSTGQLAPPAQPRRTARSQRRRIARGAGRRHAAKELFVRYGLIPDIKIGPDAPPDGTPLTFHVYRQHPAFHPQGENVESPWSIRKRGLTEKLTAEEFARALFHIIGRRGFKSKSQRRLRPVR